MQEQPVETLHKITVYTADPYPFMSLLDANPNLFNRYMVEHRTAEGLPQSIGGSISDLYAQFIRRYRSAETQQLHDYIEVNPSAVVTQSYRDVMKLSNEVLTELGVDQTHALTSDFDSFSADVSTCMRRYTLADMVEDYVGQLV